jgi:hypothetical protein
LVRRLGNSGRGAFGSLFGFFGLDDVDAHIVEHGHRVFDLL